MAAADTEDALGAPVTGQDRACREPGVWRDPVAWTIATLVFGAYYAISLFRLLQLAPASWDLGIYTEYVKQLSLLRAPIVDVRGPGFNLLGDHFQVGLAVLAPFFRLFPSPATLLFFQALADRAVGVPGHRGRIGAARAAERAADRVRLRLLPGACSR